MKCIILAAGEGKRMRPLTMTRPKVMLPLANKPMLEHLLIAAREAGIKEFIFVIGYGKGAILDYFGTGERFGVTIQYMSQREQRGTADALRAARTQVSEPFILLNGDMILRSTDISMLMQQKAPCMAVFKSDHPEDYGTVILDGERVVSLEEKSRTPKTDLINAGAYLLNVDIFTIIDHVQPSVRGELELTDALSIYIRYSKLMIYMLSFWMDVRNPWDLLDVNKVLLNVVRGTYETGEGTIIKPGVVIEGHIVIGKNCIIGPHAYIRGSTSIGDNCHIGHCTEIKNSIIMDGTKVPHFSYIGDSVIGSNCNFGAGTKIANLRHDHANVKVCGQDTRRAKFGAIVGNNVKFGINCSINAGTIIGSNTQFAPNTFVSGVVGDYTTIR